MTVALATFNKKIIVSAAFNYLIPTQGTCVGEAPDRL